MSLRELVNREIIKIDPAATISDAARMMRHFKIGSVFVSESEKYTGIVTESDIVRKVVANGFSADKSVGQFMGSPLIQINIEKSVIEANHMMRFNEIRHLAVSEKEEVIGLISVRDIVRFFSTDTKGPMRDIGEVIKPLEVLVQRDIVTVHASASSKEAAEKMAEHKIGSLIVTEGEDYIGIITESDLVHKVIGYDLSPPSIPIGVIMNSPILDVDIVLPVQSVIEIMAKKRVRHLAVTEEGSIVGIVSIRDLIGLISVRDLPRFFAKK